MYHNNLFSCCLGSLALAHTCIKLRGIVSQLGLVVRRSVGKRKDAGSTPCFSSPFSSKIVTNGHCFVTLPCTMNETVK